MIVLGLDNSRRAAAYDPTDNRWTSVASLPTDLQIDSLSAVNWKAEPAVWSAQSRDVWRYNRATDTWSPIDASPDVGPGQRALLSSAGYLFAVGTNTVAYRTTDDTTWRNAPPDPEPRASEGMSSSTARGLLVRWRDGPVMGDGSTSVLDPRTGTWASVHAPPLHGCEGDQHALELDKTQVIAFDGCGSSALFDSRTMTWSKLMLAGTNGGGAVAMGSAVLSGGSVCCFGDGENKLVVSAWSWHPPTRAP